MKKRMVDVVSPKIEVLNNENEVDTFKSILTSIDQHKRRIGIKDFEIKILENVNNCIIGIIETSQKNEIPPMKNTESRETKSLDLTEEEGLCYANIFMYDKNQNILLYEINKFGCYLNDLKEIIHLHRKEKELNVINLDFKLVKKSDDYRNRILNLKRTTKLLFELAYPRELVRKMREQNSSIMDNLNLINTFDEDSGTEFLKFEYSATSKKRSPDGLKQNFISNKFNKVLSLVGGGMTEHIKDFKVVGYAEDVENKETKRTIDFFENTFRGYFKIPKKRIHNSLQIKERIAGIKMVYDKVINEINELEL